MLGPYDHERDISDRVEDDEDNANWVHADDDYDDASQQLHKDDNNEDSQEE